MMKTNKIKIVLLVSFVIPVMALPANVYAKEIPPFTGMHGSNQCIIRTGKFRYLA